MQYQWYGFGKFGVRYLSPIKISGTIYFLKNANPIFALKFEGKPPRTSKFWTLIERYESISYPSQVFAIPQEIWNLEMLFVKNVKNI